MTIIFQRLLLFAFLIRLNEESSVVHNSDMDDLQPIDMRRRIRELLSIPERDRTDAEWDELNELEIRTAPGNRDYDRTQDRQADKRQGPMGQNQAQGRRPDRNNNKQQGNKNNNAPRQHLEGQGRPEGRSMLKRQHRRPKRPADMQGNPSGSANSAESGNTESVTGGDKTES